MPRKTLRFAALVLALLVLAAGGAACSKDKKAAKKKGGEAGEGAPAESTTSTTADNGVRVPAPLTGLPTTEANAKRPPLIVKVDNQPGVKQRGLAEADIVYEQMVEGGVTRFAALFHSTDADPVGPVRSARSTDMGIATSFNRPLFAYSGANAVFRILLRKAVFVDVGADTAKAAYQRRDDYPAPSNLFTSTAGLYGAAKFPGTTPQALWQFRAPGAAAAGHDITPAAQFRVLFPGPAGTKIRWAWDPAAGVWLREQAGAPHLDGNDKQLSAVNVIVQFTSYKDSRIRDRTSAPVPEGELVGAGEAWIFTDGKLIKGRWEKPTLTKHTTYTDGAGKPIELTAGRTWVELAPPGSAGL